MRVLLDTCVLSEFQRPRPDPRVRQAVARFANLDSFISVLSIGEIMHGIALLPPSTKQNRLSAWLQELEAHFAERILPVDHDTSRLWGELSAAARKIGRTLQTADALIAATARRHGLHIMTRNTKDFAATGALIIDPWEE